MGEVVDIASRRPRPRVLPHNLDAEASVLGGVLLRNELLEHLDHLETDDFYHLPHKVVFDGIRELQAAHKPIDVVTLEDEIERRGKLDAIGGIAFLGELALHVPTPDNVIAYAAIVRDKAIRRRHVFILSEKLDRAFNDQDETDELIAESTVRLQRLEDLRAGSGAGADPFVAAVARALVDVRKLLGTDRKGVRKALFTAAAELFDRDFPATPWLISGLVTRGGVVMIGAEPKVGKTWAGTELAIAVASGTKAFGEFFAERGTVAYFYSEDLDKQVRNRIRALATARNLDGRAAAEGLHVCPRGQFIDILDDEDMAHIVASCRAIGKVDLLILDPLRDIHGGEEDKSDSMRGVMRRLRALGELLGCTVAVVHHAPKSSKENSARRVGQNLRGSSAIHGAVDSGLYMDNAEGDGMNLLACTMTSQVKGARSAGRFALELAVTDDAHGEARTACWTVTREETDTATGAPVKRDTKADDDDIAMLMALQRQHHDGKALLCTLSHLREAKELHGVAKNRVGNALGRLEHSGRIRLANVTRTEGGKTQTRRVYEVIPTGSAQSTIDLEAPSGGLHV